MAIIRVSRGVYTQYDTILKVGSDWDFEDAGTVNTNSSGIFAKLTVDQPDARVIVGNRVEFNQVVDSFQKDIIVSSGVGQASGLFSTSPNPTSTTKKSYLLQSALRMTFDSNEADIQYQWYDITQAQFIGIEGGARSVASGGGAGRVDDQQTAVAIIKDIQAFHAFELRIKAIDQVNDIESVESYAIITQL